MAAIKQNDGDGMEELVGHQLKPFVYSNKVILSIKDWKKKELQEITRVKKLSKNSYWCSSNRVEHALYLDDSVNKIKDVGKVFAKKLNDQLIFNVQDIINMDEDKMKEISCVAKLSNNKIKKIQSTVNSIVINRLAPAEVDYRLCSDPYLAKYGPEQRMKEIKKSVTLSSNVCITEMVQHIYEESKLLFKNTPNKNNWWFWHDALSLMTAKETVLWMKENGYYSRWLLPELDLYRDYPDVKRRYEGRPIGDTPEGMPLDNNLNQDLHRQQ